MKNIQVIGLMLSLLGLTIGLFGVGTTDPQAHVFVTHMLSSKALSTLRGAGSICAKEVCNSSSQCVAGITKAPNGNPALSVYKTYDPWDICTSGGVSYAQCFNNKNVACEKDYYYTNGTCGGYIVQEVDTMKNVCGTV